MARGPRSRSIKVSEISLSDFPWLLILKRQRERMHSLVSLLIRTPILLDQGPTLMSSFTFNYLYKGPMSKYSCIGGWGFNMWIWGKRNYSAHNTLLPHTSLTLVLCNAGIIIYTLRWDSERWGLAEVQRACLCQGWEFNPDISTPYLSLVLPFIKTSMNGTKSSSCSGH